MASDETRLGKRRLERFCRREYRRNRPLQEALGWEKWFRAASSALEEKGDLPPAGRAGLRRFLRRLARKILREKDRRKRLDKAIREILPRAREAAGKALRAYPPKLLEKADVTEEDVALESAWTAVEKGAEAVTLRRTAAAVARKRVREGLKGVLPTLSETGLGEPLPPRRGNDPEQMKRTLLEEAGTLPEPVRMVFLLRLDGFAFEEIGKRAGHSRRWAAARFRKAVGMLRRSGVFWLLED